MNGVHHLCCMHTRRTRSANSQSHVLVTWRDGASWLILAHGCGVGQTFHDWHGIDWSSLLLELIACWQGSCGFSTARERRTSTLTFGVTSIYLAWTTTVDNQLYANMPQERNGSDMTVWPSHLTPVISTPGRCAFYVMQENSSSRNVYHTIF